MAADAAHPLRAVDRRLPVLALLLVAVHAVRIEFDEDFLGGGEQQKGGNDVHRLRRIIYAFARFTILDSP